MANNMNLTLIYMMVFAVVCTDFTGTWSTENGRQELSDKELGGGGDSRLNSNDML